MNLEAGISLGIFIGAGIAAMVIFTIKVVSWVLRISDDIETLKIAQKYQTSSTKTDPEVWKIMYGIADATHNGLCSLRGRVEAIETLLGDAISMQKEVEKQEKEKDNEDSTVVQRESERPEQAS